MIKIDALIIGAGPTGLFTAHQLKLIGLSCEIVDNLDKIGGQCIELYPDKPIYDIPALPKCTGESLINNLLEQIKPFKTEFHLGERVQSINKNNNNWVVETNLGKKFETPNIIIAGGVGSFEPRKIPLEGVEKFDNTNLFYAVRNKEIFKNQSICIFGGGDSALDWAVDLSNICKKIYLVHRRDEFRAAQHTVSQMNKISKTGKIEVLTSFQPKELIGEKLIEKVRITNSNSNEDKLLKVDSVLAFFGLKMELGPIAEWGLNLDKKNIKVNAENFETNEKGIFAIGDICLYPGKLKLILSGFHEAALCAKSCFKRARPDEKYVFRFTTSSSEIQKRLGVKNDNK